MENSTQVMESSMEAGNHGNIVRESSPSNYIKVLNISHDILEYTSMFVIPIGIFLNLLTVFTFLKIKYHKTSTGLNLLCLALSEFFLLVGFAISWRRPYHVTYTHSVHCIIENFIVSSQQTWSGLLMVSTTIERYVAVAFPLKIKTWNLKRISKICIVMFALISCVLGGLSAARMTLFDNKGQNQCRNNPKFVELNTFSNMFTYTILSFGLCPVLTFIFTVLIAHQLYKHKQARNTVVQDRQTNQNKEFRITLMLFIVACMFLFAKMFQIIIWYMRNYSNRRSIHFQHAHISSNFARICVILNHSANSLVYIIFFKKFREGLLSWFCCKRNDLSNEGGQRNEQRTNQSSSLTDMSSRVPTGSFVDQQ